MFLWRATMQNCLRKKTVNLLLSALVLAWGIAPPGMQHAHSGGNDNTHRHDTHQQDAHRNDACRETAAHTSHDHERETVWDFSLPADFVLHLHWQLLGVEFSIPAPEEPADNDDDRNTIPAAVVRVMNEVVPTAQAGPSFGRVLSADTCISSADLVSSLQPVPRWANQITSLPLCDSARFERSGVLLA